MTEPNYFDVRRYRAEVTQKFLAYPLTTGRDALLCSRLITCRKILEIGAGDRPFLPELLQRGYTGEFKTMDIDPALNVDYHSIEDINESFDGIVLREVIEHIPRSEFYHYLDRIVSMLPPEGLLIMTTPNPWCPGWVFADYTHISPWPPADLYAVLRSKGFGSVEIVRVIWPSRFLWLKRLYWAVHSRLYDIDFAGSYVAIARNS